MKPRLFSFFCSLFLIFLSALGQATENGVVKEYHGRDAKTSLPGVELMVHGAPSTVSGNDGSFSLRFTTFKPGDPINYAEIYKEGYVIFNKDALDVWRISSNGRLFTVVMCKEADFRLLKKKFYGIIEKSYRDEFERQKALAEKNASDALQLRRQLRELENEFNQKMADINTYVELFSRIDCSEMDSIEARALDFMEAGQIDKAIRAYEELNLERKINDQFSKWDAAENMRRSADAMESEAQADLVLLADKMQKQISLYKMGGYNYNVKRRALSDQLITLLYRLRPLTGDRYNETLGTLIVEQAEYKNPGDQLKLHREAAALPSVDGLLKLAGDFESLRPSDATPDSIRLFYNRALGLLSEAKDPNDSIRNLINEKLTRIPDGFFSAPDGHKYAYRICGADSAILSAIGPYFSVPLRGEVVLPDQISTPQGRFTVRGIGEFAFGKNPRLKKIRLPKYCRFVGPNAFLDCDSLARIVVNAVLDSVATDFKPSFPLRADLVFPDVPENPQWIGKRLDQIQQHNDSTLNIVPLVTAITDWAEKNNDTETLTEGSQWLVNHFLDKKDYDMAIRNAARCRKAAPLAYHWLMSDCFRAKGDCQNAVREGKKSLDDANPSSYNHLVYIYIDDKWPDKDFEAAHLCADKAIDLAPGSEEKANYTDSKGEIFLKQGNIEKAKECLDEALALNPSYYIDHPSALYSRFNPDYVPESQEEQNEKAQKVLRERNVAIAMMAFDYIAPSLPELDGLRTDSLRTAVLEKMADKEFIDNPKNAEDLFRETVVQAGARIFSFAKENEIPFKSDWIRMIDADNSSGMFSDSYFILSLVGITEIAGNLPCANLQAADVERIRLLNATIGYYAAGLSRQDQTIFNTLMDGLSLNVLTDRLGLVPDSISGFIDDISDNINKYIPAQSPAENSAINADSDFAHRYEARIKALLDNLEENQKNQGQYVHSFVDIAEKVATLESKYVPARENFIGVPYDELLSIGIIAAQVILRNKSPEQLKKYNIAYIATAMRWGMRNELKIRYPWYFLIADSEVSSFDPEAEKKYSDGDLDPQKIMVRIAIYRTLIELSQIEPGSVPDHDISVGGFKRDNAYIMANNAELHAVTDAIREAARELDGEMKECCGYLLSKDFKRKELEHLFSVKDINATLNYIKQKINNLGYNGY